MKKLRNAGAFASVDPTACVAVCTKVLSHCIQALPRQALPANTRVHDVLRRACTFCNGVLHTYRSRSMQRLQPVTQGVCHSDYGNESLSHACMRASETRALPRKTLPVTVAALRARATASIRALGAGFSRPHDGARRGAVRCRNGTRASPARCAHLRSPRRSRRPARCGRG